MSQLIIILGPSGQGKTRSIKGLDPKKTIVYNTIGKDLPFPGSRGMYTPLNSDNPDGNLITPSINKPKQLGKSVLKAMNVANEREHVTSFIVDDYQYVMSLEYVQGERENMGWEKFTNILIHGTDVFTEAKRMRKDLNVFLMCHTEDKKDPLEGTTTQMKTVGNAFRKYTTPEGFSTILLITDPFVNEDDETVYRFRTQTNGKDPAKSPEGMFPRYIPNNLQLVNDRIREYYVEGVELEESKALEGIDLTSETSEMF